MTPDSDDPQSPADNRAAGAEGDERKGRFARGALAGALLVAVLLAAIVIFAGESTTRYTLRFINAGQLVKGDEVQVGGVAIGSIEEIRLTDDNQADVEVTIEPDFAPLHEGTTAVIRATSLSGIANRYIALNPGPNSAPELAEGARLRGEDTTSIVDLDQLFNMLDPETREAMQQIVQGSDTWYAGRGQEANDSARYFNPAISTTQRLISELTRDEKVLTDFVVDSATVVDTLASRRDSLAGIVANGNSVAAAIGSQSESLAAALDVLPETLRRGNSTFVNLRATLDDLDPLVAASLPATEDLDVLLRELRPLVKAATPTVRDLSLLFRRDGRNNDLVELLRKMPGLEKVAEPILERSIATLEKAAPVAQFIRPYAPELVGWIKDFGQGAANYDANGHFARIQPIFSAFSFNDNPLGGVLAPLVPALRLAGFDHDNDKRCPGAATQPRPDGSNPFTDGGQLDCDPAEIPTGP